MNEEVLSVFAFLVGTLGIVGVLIKMSMILAEIKVGLQSLVRDVNDHETRLRTLEKHDHKRI